MSKGCFSPIFSAKNVIIKFLTQDVVWVAIYNVNSIRN